MARADLGRLRPHRAGGGHRHDRRRSRLRAPRRRPRAAVAAVRQPRRAAHRARRDRGRAARPRRCSASSTASASRRRSGCRSCAGSAAHDRPLPDDDAVREALRQVDDPEAGMNIVDLGLVYGIEVADGAVRVDMTMTTAACPMADMIVDQARDAVDRHRPAGNRGRRAAGLGPALDARQDDAASPASTSAGADASRDTSSGATLERRAAGSACRCWSSASSACSPARAPGSRASAGACRRSRRRRCRAARPADDLRLLRRGDRARARGRDRPALGLCRAAAAPASARWRCSAARRSIAPWLFVAGSLVLPRGIGRRAAAPARAVHVHARAGRARAGRPATCAGRLGCAGARDRAVVARLPDPDDRRRAARTVALPAAVAGRAARVRRDPRRHRRRPRRRRAAVGARGVRRRRCSRWRCGSSSRTSRGAPCAARGSRASSRCACCRATLWLAAGGAVIARRGRPRAGIAGVRRGAARAALGFVFSMVFGHAPIIFPAVLRVAVPYHPVFYVPLALLHALAAGAARRRRDRATSTGSAHRRRRSTRWRSRRSSSARRARWCAAGVARPPRRRPADRRRASLVPASSGAPAPGRGSRRPAGDPKRIGKAASAFDGNANRLHPVYNHCRATSSRNIDTRQPGGWQ